MASGRWRYEKGLQAVGDGCFAYLQPDGSWGWSNAGLICDGEASLLVDTLFDLRLTEEMLGAMRASVAAADRIDTVVNTHANGDHCYGNSLVRDARIIVSEATAEEMSEVSPEVMAQFLANADQLGAAGAFFKEAFGAFEFAGIEVPPPSETFSGEKEVTVGDKTVRLVQVGPAHTRGDVLVHSVSDRAVFTGDILFIDGTPIMWEGPIANWIRACEIIEALDVDVVVPGHGPITDPSGARDVREYLEFVRDETRQRFDAGLTVADAARDISLGRFASWGEAERLVVNVDTLYREFGRAEERSNPLQMFTLMAELAKK